MVYPYKCKTHDDMGLPFYFEVYQIWVLNHGSKFEGEQPSPESERRATGRVPTTKACQK
jgi:hypothetical protein